MLREDRPIKRLMPFFSAFNPAGTLIANARFPPGVNNYRAYFLPFDPAK
jgi:hypothetical protein